MARGSRVLRGALVVALSCIPTLHGFAPEASPTPLIEECSRSVSRCVVEQLQHIHELALSQGLELLQHCPASLSLHQYSAAHHATRRFKAAWQCTVCSKRFRSLHYLDLHHSSKHPLLANRKAPCLADFCGLVACCDEALAERETDAELGEDGEVDGAHPASMAHGGLFAPGRRPTALHDVSRIARCRDVVERCWGNPSPQRAHEGSAFASRVCMGLQDHGRDAAAAAASLASASGWWAHHGAYLAWAGVVLCALLAAAAASTWLEPPREAARRVRRGLPVWGVAARLQRFVRRLRREGTASAQQGLSEAPPHTVAEEDSRLDDHARRLRHSSEFPDPPHAPAGERPPRRRLAQPVPVQVIPVH